MLFFGKDLGLFIFTTALSKLTIVFTNAEGTFLRRNLFVVFGLCDFLAAYLMFTCDEYFMSAFDETLKPLMAAAVLEGSVFLFDALFRSRDKKVTEPKKK